MEEMNWETASNSELKAELERLQGEFEKWQSTLKELVEAIDEINQTLGDYSKQYVEIKQILNKREGKIQ